MPNVSLIIVGSGLQGITLYVNLPTRLRERTLIIDKEPSPLFKFYQQAKNVGMKYLRSPASHCLKEPLLSLLLFSKKHTKKNNHDFQGRYVCPSFSLLQNYLQYLLEQTSFASHFLQATLKKLVLTKRNTWELETSKGNISSKNCILALGMEKVHLPANITIQSDNPNHTKSTLKAILIKKHILNTKYTNLLENTAQQLNIAIIGGGMSGTQCALKYCSYKNVQKISLISGKGTKLHFFDSDPGYIGPKYRNQFLQENDYKKRRDMITKARFPGSINPYVYDKLRVAKKQKKIEHIQQYAKSLNISSNSVTSKYNIELSNKKRHTFDEIIFATGFGGNTPPYKKLVEDMIHSYDCKADATSWPIPEKTLMWHKGLYLVGALAELEIGPAARNIIGAHLAYRTFKHFWDQWI